MTTIDEAIARAEQAEAQLASHQIDIDTFREGNMQLRAQLAGAKADYAAALSALELANMPKVPEEAMYRCVELLAEANTRAEQAEARIVELDYLAKRLDEARSRQPDWEKLWEEAVDRAERAEAERDALRIALQHVENHELRDHEDYEAIQDIARAALAGCHSSSAT